MGREGGVEGGRVEGGGGGRRGDLGSWLKREVGKEVGGWGQCRREIISVNVLESEGAISYPAETRRTERERERERERGLLAWAWEHV